MRYRHITALLVMLLFCCLVPLRNEHAQEGGGERWQPAGELESNLIIVRSGDGISCRSMTRQEAEDLRIARGRGELRELTADEPMRLEAQQTGMKIILRATSQLDANPTARQAFLRAAAYWESIIKSPITVVIDVDFGPTRFGIQYPSPNIIGATSNQALTALGIFEELRNKLIAGAPGAQERAVFTALPNSSLVTDIGTTGTIFIATPVLRALGFISAAADPASELGFGLPPSIGFNSAFGFDFEPADGIDIDKVDFNATAIHEIGHALGFSSSVGNAERSPLAPLSVNFWDCYRFRPGVTIDNFGTASRVLLSGGEHIYFAGFNDVSLSTARNDGLEGDGRQASHWKDDTLTGQLLGIMDPTLSSGLRDEGTAEDVQALVSFGYQVSGAVAVAERLSVDDNRRDAQPVANNAMVVNRFTPSRYPATLRSAIIQIPITGDQPSPVGSQLRIVVLADPNRTGQPPAGATPIFNQVFTIPNITSSRFVEFTFSGPVIGSGDFYLGIQTTAQQLGIPIDTTGAPKPGSFISLNNGVSFQPLNTLTGGSGAANFMARAVVTSQFDVVPTPALTTVSPAILPPGGAGATILLRGTNFRPDSIVRWNGADRPTTFITGSQLQASLSGADLASAGTANVTVFTPASGSGGGGSSTAFAVSIGSSNPVPSITRLDPPSAARSTEPFVVNVLGLNFSPASKVRVGGSERDTVFVSSQQLRVTLTAADMATPGALGLTVFSPAPGGGTSGEQSFGVILCTYQLSTLSQSVASVGGDRGVMLTVGEPCRWTVTSDSSWVSVLNPTPAAGTGKHPIRLSVQANSTPSSRQARLTIGGQIMVLDQYGLLSNVSAASYSAAVTPESIVAGFGLGLARTTTSASALPLPTNLSGTAVSVQDMRGVIRPAPLFFVSPQQVNYLMPADTAAGIVGVTLSIDSVVVSTGVLTVSTVAPALFAANSSGRDVAAASIVRLRNGAVTFEQVASFSQTDQKFQPLAIDFGPESDQLFLALFGTGIRGRTSLANVVVRIADLTLAPSFAGAQPEFVGLDQVNVELPRSLRGRGGVNVSITVDGKLSNQVTLNFR